MGKSLRSNLPWRDLKLYNVPMGLIIVLPYYLRWHYSRALSDIRNIWGNFIFFFYNFFSIKSLAFNLLSPWVRIHEEFSREITFETTVGTIIVNALMRLVGAVIRLVFICIGLLFIFVTLLIGIFIFCIWLFLPLVVFYMFMNGIFILIS